MAMADRIESSRAGEPAQEPIDRALLVVAGAARASTTLNILQQTGASIGTAVLSVLLASAISSHLGGSGHGTIGAGAALAPSVRAHIAPPMAVPI